MDVNWPIYKVGRAGNYGYVMGTFHLGERSMYPFPVIILAALEESGQLITELSDAESSVASTLLQEKALLAPEQSLDQLLSADGMTLLKARADEYGIAFVDIERYRPWFIANYFSLEVYNNEFGKSSFYGVDNQLQRLAARYELVSVGLEGAEEQLETIVAAYPDEEADIIIQTIPSKADMEIGIEQMYEMYITNDDSNAVMNEAMNELDASLTFERNQLWLPVIETAIQNGVIPFVAVGFGHLHGEGGLLQLLQALGYEVEQLLNS